jgi:CYTH domain-containing protein
MMDKTAQTELHRLFLIEGLPEPLTAASSHLQIFDNYLPGTRLRLRKIRDPQTSDWTHILQQRFAAAEGEYGKIKLAEIYLNKSEYVLFERFEAREVRKNRYFHEVDNMQVAFDVYLGRLMGLTTAKFVFESLDKMDAFIAPPFALIDITGDQFFFSENLVRLTADDVREKLSTAQKLS